MATLKAVRGTRDLLPPETALWNRIEATARQVFARYNFGEIRTPIFEDTALFARSVGEETDIVSKEMYTWEDRARAQSEKTQSLTLRPENTAGVVRAYIEHGLGESGQLQKLYYIGPQFRRERPQKGRYRQFWQIGAEVIGPPSSGSESPLRDAEVLEMLAALLEELGISGWTLELNSVGSSADRAKYNDVLRAALVDVAPKMCGDCQRRAVTMFFRMIRTGKAPIVGSGENLRSMSYIDNLCQGLLLAATSPRANGETYWIADRRPYSMNEVVDTIERLLETEFNRPCAQRSLRLPGFAAALALMMDRAVQAAGFYHQKIHVLAEMNRTIACSVAKAEQELDYHPVVELEEGMRRSLAWCIERGLEI